MVGSELPSKVGEREETVGIIEALLVFPMAALDLTIVSGRVRTNELVTDVEADGGGFKECRAAAVLGGEAIGKLRAIVGLNTFDADAMTGIPGNRLFKEVR